MQNIIIVNECTIIRKGLINILSEVIVNCKIIEAKSLSELLNLIGSQIPDLIIMDINLSDKSGLYVIKHLKVVLPDVPILLISSINDEELIKRCLASGASGYMNINSEQDEISLAIQNILRGLKYISSDLIYKFILQLNDVKPVNPFHGKLSDREFEVLRLIGKRKTPTQIAEILSLSIKTISTYKARILVKLNLNSSEELLCYAIGNDQAYENEFSFN